MFRRRKRIAFKNKVNLISSGLLIFLGILMFAFKFLENIKPTRLLYVLFAVYAGIKLIEYILTRNEGDRENLYTFIACSLASISGFKFGSESSPMVLGITLASWVGIMAVIKLIKLDFYHDNENGMFYVNLVTFGLFILLGLLTSINLYHDKSVEILLLAFFFIINGLLSLCETGIMILATSKKIDIDNINK